ncbi:uncharacterized protein QC764_700690 [Podospora pseudoanserina]|uniref:Tyrosinase copper-binding domain-containing protein n=1 Tax=Podospora pseudoanserina TaxID=2609844 RepID=A0ABR0HM73_9PEZI|nr:hypothetical protein QC764_700690 [Podospora pseudoanserina]
MKGIQGVVQLSLLVGAWGWEYKTKRNPAFPLDVVDKLQDETMPKVQAWLDKQHKAGKATNCTLENAAVRQEWSDMTVEARQEYVRAVLCLQKKSPRAPKDKVPGSLSRFDDFVATHMTQAGELHGPTNLFAAHRYFIYVYEKALREECGYTGYQPYMNYDRYVADPLNSLLFDGSPASMSGNGELAPYNGIPQPFPRPYDRIPADQGGGCVTTGPFKDMVVSLGPKGSVVRDIPPNPQRDGLGSNPRCLRRDVNRFSVAGAKANYTYHLITQHNDVDSFYNRYLGQPQLKGDPNPWGLHNAGHYLIGGDPGGDFYCSPGDPLFYFHHGALDRIWWIWQMNDPENRINAVPGQAMPGGHNHGRRQTTQPKNALDSVIDLGWTAPGVRLEEMNDQLGGLGGEMCYIYV